MRRVKKVRRKVKKEEKREQLTITTSDVCTRRWDGYIEEESDRREDKGRRCWLLIQFHAPQEIYHQDDLKKRMNIRTTSWRNWWSSVSQQVITLPKWMFFQKKFLQIIHAGKWLVWHSSTSPQTAATTFAFSSVWFWKMGDSGWFGQKNVMTRPAGSLTSLLKPRYFVSG